jgi:hypothetical protein
MDYYTGSIWRGIGFTLVGGLGTLLIAAFEGALTGGVLGSFIEPNGATTGTVIGALMAAIVGAATGLVAFAFAFRSDFDFARAVITLLKQIAMHSFWMIGAVIAAAGILYPLDQDAAGLLYFFGVIAAFIVGTAYGTRKALRNLTESDGNTAIGNETKRYAGDGTTIQL